jgi:hypothetical protein
VLASSKSLLLAGTVALNPVLQGPSESVSYSVALGASIASDNRGDETVLVVAGSLQEAQLPVRRVFEEQ